MAGPVEGFNPTPFGRLLYSRQEFANYAQKFTADGDTRITQTASGRQVAKPNFGVDDVMIGDFREMLKANRIKVDDAAFTKDTEFIRSMIRYEIDLALFGIGEARRHLIGADPQAQLALSLFSEAQKLNGLGKGASQAQ
jgi:hypothetical protein